jgi:hypothetical protein
MGLMPDNAAYAEMANHIDAAREELSGLTRQLYAQQINLQQWEVGASGVLKDIHLANSTFARGGAANMGSVEFGRVGGALADEYRFLHNFAQDIHSGRISEAQALARIDQYGKAAQQAYWREYSLMREKVWWNLRPGESCTGCRSLAAGSPYNRGQLTVFPGSGSTVCRGGCNCTLTEEEGAIAA